MPWICCLTAWICALFLISVFVTVVVLSGHGATFWHIQCIECHVLTHILNWCHVPTHLYIESSVMFRHTKSLRVPWDKYLWLLHSYLLVIITCLYFAKWSSHVILSVHLDFMYWYFTCFFFVEYKASSRGYWQTSVRRSLIETKFESEAVLLGCDGSIISLIHFFRT